jgi:hypothetical protein
VRLVEPFTFFVDRSLGSGVVVQALRAAKERVLIHDDHFAADAPDTEWLMKVGAHGWVVLTKDARIRTNALERDALMTAKVAAFMLGRGDSSGPTMARAFVAALPRIKTTLRRYDVPLVGVVSIVGNVSVLYANGVRLPKSRVVK